MCRQRYAFAEGARQEDCYDQLQPGKSEFIHVRHQSQPSNILSQETYSTDFDVPDRLYFEELSYERVMDIYELESATGVVVSVGGQLPQNIALRLQEDGGAKILGTDPQDIDKAERTGRSQQPRLARRDTNPRRQSPPPNQDLSYADRHYRPSEASTVAGTANSSDRRVERGVPGSSYYPEAPYVPARSPSPPLAGGDKRPARSSSPQWDRKDRSDPSPAASHERGVWRDSRGGYSQDRQAGGSDSGWGRSQEYTEVVQSVSRSPSNRRNRRRDDIEPPIRRKDDIEPPIGRKGEIEGHTRRKEDVEPRIRRKDDIEPRVRRKDDIEPPLRRRDDVEPPLRPLPPSTRHTDEWSAPSTSTFFASSSASRLSPGSPSRGGGQVHADCLVKPRESVSPYTVSPPNISCTYEDASPGRFDPVFSVPLPYSCLTLQSLLLRTLFLFSCRTSLSAATPSARTSTAKAQRATSFPEPSLSRAGVK